MGSQDSQSFGPRLRDVPPSSELDLLSMEAPEGVGRTVVGTSTARFGAFGQFWAKQNNGVQRSNGGPSKLSNLVGVQTRPSFGGKIYDGIEEFEIVGLPKNWRLTGLTWDMLFETNRYIGI